jgi:hypothetical protein
VRKLFWKSHAIQVLGAVFRDKFHEALKPAFHHQPGQPGHGPNFRLTYKVDGKTISEALPTPAVQKGEREVEEFRKFRQLTREFLGTNAEICRLRPLEEAETELKKNGRSDSPRDHTRSRAVLVGAFPGSAQHGAHRSGSDRDSPALGSTPGGCRGAPRSGLGIAAVGSLPTDRLFLHDWNSRPIHLHGRARAGLPLRPTSSLPRAAQQACAESWARWKFYVPTKTEGQPAHTREVKLGCVFTQTTWDKEGYAIRDPDSTTYTGAIESAEEFGRRIYAEAHGRGWSRALKKVVIGDGAEWIWNLVALHFSEAIQIVDLYHARQHLWEVARKLYPNSEGKQKAWMKIHQKRLLDRVGGKLKSWVGAHLCKLLAMLTLACPFFSHPCSFLSFVLKNS